MLIEFLLTSIALMLFVCMLILMAGFGLIVSLKRKVVPNEESSAIILSAKLMDEIQKENDAVAEQGVRKRIAKYPINKLN